MDRLSQVQSSSPSSRPFATRFEKVSAAARVSPSAVLAVDMADQRTHMKRRRSAAPSDLTTSIEALDHARNMKKSTIENTPSSIFVEGAGAPIVGRLRNAEIGIARIGFGRKHDHLHVRMDPQDAYYVIFQLRDFPAHEHWANGRAAPAPASPRGGVHIADLNAAPSALLTGRFDSLNMVITRAFPE